MNMYANGMNQYDFQSYVLPTRPHSSWADLNEEDEEWQSSVDLYFMERCDRSQEHRGVLTIPSSKIPLKGIYPLSEPLFPKRYKKKKKCKKVEVPEINVKRRTTSLTLSTPEKNDGKVSPFKDLKSPDFFTPSWKKRRKSSN